MTDETPTAIAASEIPTKPVELPADLNAHVQTIRAFAQTHNVLVQGQFPVSHFKVVQDCVEFIKMLHGHAIDTASKHESADLVPELAAFKAEKATLEKKTQDLGVANGQA